jgi:hypothetical protein
MKQIKNWVLNLFKSKDIIAKFSQKDGNIQTIKYKDFTKRAFPSVYISFKETDESIIKIIKKKKIRDGMFFCDVIDEYTNKLIKVTIPNSVEIIGEWAFAKNKELKTVVFGNRIKEIQNRAFYNTRIEELPLLKSLTHIGEYAFSWCLNLKELTFGENLKTIEEGAFYWCYHLKEVNLFNTKVEIIKQNTFYKTKLTSIRFPITLKEIEENAFSECDNLKQVYIPKNTQCHKNAFPNHTQIMLY